MATSIQPKTSDQKTRGGVRIRVVLTAAFAGLIGIAVGTVMYFDAQSALLNTRQLVSENTAQFVDSVSLTLRRYLGAAREQVQFLGRMAEEERLSLTDETSLALALEAALAAAPQIQTIGFASSSSVFVAAVRTEDGVRVIHQSMVNDEVVQDALFAAQASTESFWGNQVYVPPINDIALNSIMPVRRGEEFLGFFFASVGISTVSQFLADIGRQHRAVPFVVAGEYFVIAHPNLRGWFERTHQVTERPTVEDLDDPVLTSLARGRDIEPASLDEKLVPAGFAATVVSLEDARRSLVVYTDVFGVDALPWVVGAHFPMDDFDTYFGRITKTIIAGVVVLALAIVAALLASVIISRPVLRLVAAADELRSKGPKEASPLPSSLVFELNTASHAFNDMVEGLRERETIRETFGKYVPESIAAGLVKHGGVLKPQTKVATVLFTDIAGFSTVSEKLSPEQLIATLNEYFSVVLAPVQKYSGVIHQFQGDAILATYNLPLDDPDHATHAIKTAIELQEVLAGRTFGPGVSLPTRVGINTGAMVGGTVGAGDRLGYTVHGDDVNVAARIQELNKRYGTNILVAESTVELAREHFDFEPIGEVPIRGREGTEAVYRLLPHEPQA